LGAQIKPAGLLHFGAFQFDCLSGDLRRNGTSLRLPPQPAKILALLIGRAGEVVTRQELIKQVWGAETFVDFEQGLNYAIRQIRAALEDDAEQPQFLETLPKRGYRFIAPVMERAAPVEVEAPAKPVALGEATPKILLRRKIVLAASAAAVIALVVSVWILIRNSGTSSAHAIASLAVLPLQNLSGDPSQDYFADGMTDELTTQLAKIRSIRVISRTSAMRYKNAQKPLAEIARELNVDAVVEGSIVRSGNRLKLTAQLIDASTDRHLWADSYERDLRDIVSMQVEVAQKIAGQIRASLNSEEKNNLANTSAVNPEAFDAYIRGRYFWNKRTEPDLTRGLAYFKEAIEKDPGYAPAYAGEADCYIMLANWGFVAPEDAYPKAKAAARTALQLNDSLAEAHTSLGYTELLYEWNWGDAEKEFRRAIDLNPSYASAHQFYSILLMASGRRDEALAEIRRAQQLDPLSLIVNDVVGWIYYEERQYEQARQQYAKTLEMEPNYVAALLDLGTVHLRMGDSHKALEQFEQARKLSAENSLTLSSLAQAYALSGKRAAARQVLRHLEQLSTSRFVSPWDVALVHAALGDRNMALTLLEKAADKHVGWIIRLGVDPALDSLRSEPRFKKLQERVHVPREATLTSSLDVDPTWEPLREDPRFAILLSKLGFSRLRTTRSTS
jgi:TolB-like protein/DNA-binding winged helix-turn-helix (wHTH) protein/Tfp pilus assembly protein PilF